MSILIELTWQDESIICGNNTVAIKYTSFILRLFCNNKNYPFFFACQRHAIPETPYKRNYTTSNFHIVFRTYRSERTIPIEHEKELYAYIYGIAKDLHCQTYRIGGMPDHIHILVSLPANLSLASFVQRVKTDSSKWLKTNPHFPAFRGWGREYAGFSYSCKDRNNIINYIIHQKQHHRTASFAEEYKAFVEENGISVDERYFLRDDE